MKAIILNLSAWVILPIMDGFAKFLSTDLPILQITWARYFFTVFFILPIMFFFFKKNLVWTDKPKLQILRGLTLLTANIFFFLLNFSYFAGKSFNFSFYRSFNCDCFFTNLFKRKCWYKEMDSCNHRIYWIFDCN